MNLLSILILELCLSSTRPNCVEVLHVCVRDKFQVNFFDKLTWQQELVLPVQIQWCVDHE